MPRVSIIIPVFNAGSFLKDAVDSALGQTYSDIEVIIVDDGSTDGCVGSIKEDDRLIKMRQKNMGESVARNRGAEKAKGDSLIFLDADDILDPEMVSLCKLTARTTEKYKFICGGRAHFCDGLNPSPYEQPLLQDDVWLAIAKGNIPILGQCMVSRAAHMEIGGFDPSIKYGEDYDYLLRLANVAKCEWINAVFLYKREHRAMQTRSRSQPDIVKNRLHIIAKVRGIGINDSREMIGAACISDWLLSQALTKCICGRRWSALLDVFRSLVIKPNINDSIYLIKRLITKNG